MQLDRHTSGAAVAHETVAPCRPPAHAPQPRGTVVRAASHVSAARAGPCYAIDFASVSAEHHRWVARAREVPYVQACAFRTTEDEAPARREACLHIKGRAVVTPQRRDAWLWHPNVIVHKNGVPDARRKKARPGRVHRKVYQAVAPARGQHVRRARDRHASREAHAQIPQLYASAPRGW